METKEQKAKEYAENLMNESRPYHVEKYGMERAKRMSDFDIYHVEEAYSKGWDEALKSQWINIDKGFPKEWQDVLMLHIKDGEARVSKATYIGDGVWVYGDVMTTKNKNVVAWLLIPSFDEILNNNKDVLKRLKDR